MGAVGDWERQAKEYVTDYENSMQFARLSISTLRPLVFDQDLQAALDDSYENHVLVHLRNVLSRDVVSFVWKAFDTNSKAISLRKLVAPSIKHQPFWSGVEQAWKEVGGIRSSCMVEGDAHYSGDRKIKPSSVLLCIRRSLNSIKTSEKFTRLERFRHSIVAHLENPKLADTSCQNPTYFELLDVAEEVYELGLAAINLITLTSPSAHREDTRFYAEGFWKRLGGSGAKALQFGDERSDEDWIKRIL